MSGAQTSTFPDQNKLLEANAQQLANYYAPEKNRLLIETAKQEAGQREMEVMSRIATGLMGLPEDQRANAYPGAVQYAQSLGFGKNAPPVYPGHEKVAQLASLGIPAEKQYEQQGVRTAARNIRESLTGDGTAGPGAPAESPVISGDTQARAQAVHDGMVKRGWSDTAAWGFAANAVQESGGRPDAAVGDGGRSHGVFQWNGDRLAAFQQKYGMLPGQATLDQQLDFANDELGGSEKGSADAIRNATTPGQAAAVISSGYLRPLDIAGEQVRRAGIASRLTQGLNTGTTATTTPAPAVPAAPPNRLLPAIGGGPPGGGFVGINQPMPGGNADVLGALEPEQPAPTRFAGPGVPLPPPPSTTGGFVGPGLEGGSAGNVLGGLTSVAPAAPAPAPAATPSVLPPLPPAPTPTNPRTGLTQDQARTFQGRLDTARTPAQLDQVQKDIQTAREHNDVVKKEYDAAVYARQEKAQADARSAAAEARAQAEADRKAAAAAKQEADLLADKAEDQRIERTLTTIGPKIRRGDPITDEEKDVYTLMWNKYRDGPIQAVPDGKGGTFMARVPREVPPNFPPPPGQTVTAGPKPIPGTEQRPPMAPPAVVGGMLANASGQSKIVRTLADLEGQSGSVGFVANAPDWLLQRGDPEGVQLRASVSDIAGHQFHDLSGAAVSPTEAARLKFIPSEHDTADALKTKLNRMLAVNRDIMLQSYRTYGPENNGARVPAVEEAIIDSIPQEAQNALKDKPDLARDFDKKYGKGAAKLVLNNG